eukprot:symbB.v1.2.031140.t1/scaffold3582.1/size53800/3
MPECNASGILLKRVPRPPVIVDPPQVINTSVKTLVIYGVLILWLPFLLPLLVWALMGDLILNLHGEEVTKKLAEGLLPAVLISGGVWGEAEKALEKKPWPLRCSFSLHFVAFLIFLRSYCGSRRKRWQDEAKDLLRYRNALCYARLKGSRVMQEPEVKALERPPEPVQDPTIRERAPVAKWRKGPAALPAPAGGDTATIFRLLRRFETIWIRICMFNLILNTYKLSKLFKRYSPCWREVVMQNYGVPEQIKISECSFMMLDLVPMAEEESVQALRKWLESKGAKISQLRVADVGATASEERGVFASEKIGTGEVIAEVPQSCVLSAERARQSPVGQAFTEVFPEDKHRDKIVFLLDLVAARVDPEHPMHVYVSSLPKESPTPMSWPSNLRAMLSNTNLGAAVDEEREQLEEQFGAIMPKLQQARPTLFGEQFNFENFVWAHGMWFSRRYPTAMASFDKGKNYSWQRFSEEDMEEESDGEGALVPFMDFTNHRSGTKIVWRADADKVTFVSKEGVDVKAEVFNNYGDKSNEDLMLIHGFALLDNVHDTYGLWLTVQVSDQRRARKRRRALRTERIGPFHLRRKDPRWKQFPDELWQALSANSGSEHMRALGNLLQQQLQEFQETKTRDRHFAAGGAAEGQDVDPRIRYIARYRDGQRQVLEECCKALEEMVGEVAQATEMPTESEPRAQESGMDKMSRTAPGYSKNAVKAQPQETEEPKPKLLSNQPDPIGALLKQPDAFEEQAAKQAIH